MRARARLALAGVVLATGGAFLARTTEPSVDVRRIDLATGPAIRLAPVTSQARATALLAHGVTARKETLFRVGEALAASGFECLLVDFPGHGESRVAFRGDLGAVLVEGARALSGTTHVDVIVGHSMGAGVAARTLDEGRVDAKLLLAFGSLARARDVETLHLEGKWDELHDAPPGSVVSRSSDHCVEPWDPVLVDAAVKKACDVTGKTPVAVSRWKLRLLGGVLVLAGSVLLVVGGTAERAAGGLFAAAVVIAGVLLASPLWVGGIPTLAHLPVQIVVFVMAAASLLALGRATRARAHRVQVAVTGLGLVVALAAALIGISFGALVVGIATGVSAVGAALGAFVEARTKNARAAHVAWALWVGYVLGGWWPRLF